MSKVLRTLKQSKLVAPEQRGELVFYRGDNGVVILDVRLQRETIWLTQKQMSVLFDKDADTVGFHIRNIYKDGELDEVSTTEDSSVVQLEGKRKVNRAMRSYNLDVIISVGYRINSKRGTQFRMWATKVLKDNLLKGFTVNDARLKQLNQTVKLVADLADRSTLIGDEAKALLAVVRDYAQALQTLDDYDHQRIVIGKVSKLKVKSVTTQEVRQIISDLAATYGASSLFGAEKDSGLEGSLVAVMQTFAGHDLYPSFEEKASHLLYFLVKNHHFADGNKRIAAAVFLWFMEKNNFLYRRDGTKRIADNALVAMTLLVAESKPEEKPVLTTVLVNLISRKNK